MLHDTRGGYRRRAMTAWDTFWTLVALLLLAAIVMPSCTRRPQLSKRAVCASNLRGIGQSVLVYADECNDQLPRHYFELREPLTGTPPDHGVSWVGAMGSHEELKISEATSPTKSPRHSHPSRSLFLLITHGVATSKQFICPSTHDYEDELRNFGPDASGPDSASAAQPGVDRFDFAGYDRLSYGYQLPFQPTVSLHKTDPHVVLFADKGPYYAAGTTGLDGTRTMGDQRSVAQPPAADAAVGDWDLVEWRPFNSVNHATEGQNVCYADGHATFERRPTVGLRGDNIYTIQTNADAGRHTGMVPAATQTLGPANVGDSFIVP